jgi:cytochrome c oxidase subunit 4
MSEHNAHPTTDHEHGHDAHSGLSKKKIWEVFAILLFITIVEFFIALWVIPNGYMSHSVGNFLYIALTLLKAFYIIAYFMHLKFEKFGLQLCVSLVFVFIVYFIVLMLIEGGYLHLHMT